MDSEKVIKRDNEYVLHTYARNPIAIEKGHGLYAEGPEGQKYPEARHPRLAAIMRWHLWILKIPKPRFMRSKYAAAG